MVRNYSINIKTIRLVEYAQPTVEQVYNQQVNQQLRQRTINKQINSCTIQSIHIDKSTISRQVALRLFLLGQHYKHAVIELSSILILLPLEFVIRIIQLFECILWRIERLHIERCQLVVCCWVNKVAEVAVAGTHIATEVL